MGNDEQWFDMLDDDLKALWLHPDQEQNRGTDQDEPGPFLNGIKEKEKKIPKIPDSGLDMKR